MFGEKLKRYIEAANTYPQKLAEDLMVKPQSVSGWLSGDSKPKRDRIPDLARLLNVKAETLLHDLLDIPEKENEAPGTSQGSAPALFKTIRVPFYDISASAGHGCFVDAEKVEKYITVSEDILRSELQSDPSGIAIIKASGDSMEGTIQSGELLAVDTNVKQLGPDGIYVVRINGALNVKRIHQIPSGEVDIISDNQKYPAMRISLKDESLDFTVCGRVTAIISVKKVW